MAAYKISYGSGRGLGCEKFPAASYAFHPNLEKGLVFAIGEGWGFCRVFSKQQRPKVLISDAWPTPATCHRPFCELCCPRSRFRRYIDTYRGRVCSPAAVRQLAPEYWLRCVSLLLKSCNTRYPCPVSEAEVPVCPSWLTK